MPISGSLQRLGIQVLLIFFFQFNISIALKILPNGPKTQIACCTLLIGIQRPHEPNGCNKYANGTCIIVGPAEWYQVISPFQREGSCREFPYY